MDFDNIKRWYRKKPNRLLDLGEKQKEIQKDGQNEMKYSQSVKMEE